MNDLKTVSSISPKEDVVRLINNAWVDNGELLYAAFTFAPKETYLSVNRPNVETYNSDVRDFIINHIAFQIEECPLEYRRALMHVGEIDKIKISVDGDELAVRVEVEPRTAHIKSHAGIFVRAGEQNIVSGRLVAPGVLPAGVSTDHVLQKIAWKLKELAELQVCRMEESE